MHEKLKPDIDIVCINHKCIVDKDRNEDPGKKHTGTLDLLVWMVARNCCLENLLDA